MSATLVEVDFTPSPTDAAKTIAEAQSANLTKVVIYGYDEAGEPFFSSSTSDLAEVAFILTRAMHKLNLMADQKA